MIYWNNLLTGFILALVCLVLLLRYGYIQKANYITQNKVSIFNIFFSCTNSKKDYIIFFSICLLAIAVRLWDFGATPAGFNQDGAMAAVDAKALADYGTDRFGMKYPVQFTAWGYGQMSVMLSYLMVPFIKLAGLNEITARLPALILSIVGLLALYGLIRGTFGRTTALIVFFLAAINPWHIMQSRWALDCNIFPHFFILGCYLLLKGMTKKYFLYLSMISFSMCMYSYGVSFFTVPLFLMIIAAYVLTKKIISIKDIFICISIYTLLALPVWLVMVINFLKLSTINTPIFTMAYFPESVRSGDIIFFSKNFLAQLHDNMNALLRTTIYQRPDHPWNALDNFGTQYLFSLPLVMLGFYYVLISILHKESRSTESVKQNHAAQFGAVIIIAGLAIGFWTGLVIASVNVNRINIVYYFLIIMGGIGLSQLLKWLKPAFIISVSIYVIFFGLFCNHYFGTWSKEIGSYFFDGMGKALHQAAKIDTPRYYITVNSQFNGAKNVSEILTLFHHRIDAKYFQGENIAVNSDRLSAETISGNKYGIPYAQRYIYINPFSSIIDPNEKAVYIVNNNELGLFNTFHFNITTYNSYSLAVPKHFQ